ncbi:MAG: hypothetical protein ACLFOA_06190 [Desulfohalobiaceae bacterium]
MQMQNKGQIQAQDLPVWRSISLALRVIGSELHWSLIRGLRNWEIKQLQRRLRKEYQELGRLKRQKELGQAADDQEQAIELCNQQIDFLEKELQFLQQELQRVREDLVSQRRSKWGI